MILHWDSYTFKLPNQTVLSIPERSICKDTVMGIFGESGSGKSIFLQHLFDKYRAIVDIAYMKQDVHFYPHLTVGETLLYYNRLRNITTSIDVMKDMLRDLQIEFLLDRKIHVLSGGERKRIMLANVLLHSRAALLLLDEPFSGLDDDNMVLVFHLLCKYKHRHCILLTIHQLPSFLLPLLTERWTLSHSTLSYENNNNHPESSEANGELSDIYLSDHDEDTLEITTPHQQPSLFRQFLILSERDWLVHRRNLKPILFRLWMPFCISILQGLMIGFFHGRLKTWILTGNVMNLMQVLFNYTIMLFTMSMIPLAMLSDHFEKRAIVLHETSQGLYSYGAYLLNAICIDQFFMTLITASVASVSFLPEPIFLVYFFTLLAQLLFTNLCIWFLVYGAHCSYDMSQLFVIAYLSVSFLLNTPALNPMLNCVRFLSMNHAHTDMLIRSMEYHYPMYRFSMEQVISIFGMKITSHSWLTDLVLFCIPIFGLLFLSRK